MGLVHDAIKWYSFTRGVGKQMLDHGATLMPCPHCEKETPVFQSAYNSAGLPISFSVCRWCDGIIEHSGATRHPHEPYATAREIQTKGRRSKP